jgi:multidrug efflux pump subunit AcrA (membrane-fusion protein)
MLKLMRMRAVGGVAIAVAIATVIVWSQHRAGGPAATPPELVTVARGDVALTVGGIGHVTTLTGAASLAVPAAASGGGSGGASGSTSTSAVGPGASPGAGTGGGSLAVADTVFASAPGHVRSVLVKPGDRVAAGQPVAQLADDGTIAGGVLQARSDLATARLELAQRQVHDPARGLPPTQAELAAGRAGVIAAQAKLGRLLAPPLSADVSTARLDVAKAVADLAAARAGGPHALAAAELAVDTARRRLATVSGTPDPADVTAARLDLGKATLDQETLLRPPEGPTPLAVQAADAAVAAAEQKLADAQASGTAADVAAARAELARARSDRDAQTRPGVAPSTAAQASAQLAVDAARQRLDAIVTPPAATVSAAQRDLAAAQADLAALRTARGATGLAAVQAGVAAARARLVRLRHPTRDTTAAARSDVGRAQADLAVLRQRGAPASTVDLALARLKVSVGAQRLALAQDQTRRLTVPARASGIVTSVLTVPGAAADATTPLLRVEDLDHLVVAVDLSEFDVGRVRAGAPVRVSADALGGQEFGGHVRDIASAGVATGGVVNFPVIVSLNSHHLLRPGMSVGARVIVARRRGVVRIPLAAVHHAQDSPTVTVRSPSGGLRRRAVVLGLSGSEFVEVRSGLRAGERIALPASTAGA